MREEKVWFEYNKYLVFKEREGKEEREGKGRDGRPFLNWSLRERRREGKKERRREGEKERRREGEEGEGRGGEELLLFTVDFWVVVVVDVVDIVEFFVWFYEHVRGLVPLALFKRKKERGKGGGKGDEKE